MKELLRARKAQEAQQESDEQFLARAQAFEQLIRTPAWKYLVEFLTAEDESAHQSLAKANTDDPWACQAAILKFLDRRKLLQDFEQHVLGTIEGKKELEKESKSWQTETTTYSN